jgi:hypothetical protein
MHFLVIDNRFGSAVFVFLECDPNESGGSRKLRGRWVTLEQAAPSRVGTEPAAPIGLASAAAIGGDPDRSDRFAVFESDGEVRAAGYSLIEPRYVGPSWETYLSIFHPEGGKRNMSMRSREKPPGQTRGVLAMKTTRRSDPKI